MLADKPIVSIVMPNYNYGHLIQRAIDSVLNQSFASFELIIVDNFSADNTDLIVKGYRDSRIKYFKFSNHGIIAASRNKGVALAQGDYIAFLDSDDFWYPEKLTLVMDYFERNKNVDLVCHDEKWCFENGRQKIKVYGPHCRYQDLLYKGNSLSTSAIVVKKIFLNQSGCFSEKAAYAGVEDYDLWLKLSRVGRIDFFHQVLGEYYIHQSAFSTENERFYQHLLNVVEDHYRVREKKFGIDMCIFYFWLRKSNIVRESGRDFLKKKDIPRARQRFIQALKLNPFLAKAWFALFKSFFTKYQNY